MFGCTECCDDMYHVEEASASIEYSTQLVEVVREVKKPEIWCCCLWCQVNSCCRRGALTFGGEKPRPVRACMIVIALHRVHIDRPTHTIINVRGGLLAIHGIKATYHSNRIRRAIRTHGDCTRQKLQAQLAQHVCVEHRQVRERDRRII